MTSEGKIIIIHVDDVDTKSRSPNSSWPPMSKTKIFLLPYWAVDTLHRQKLNTSQICDLATVRKYLSINDIAGILAMSKFNEFLLDSKNNEFTSNISYEWSVSATPQDKSFLYDQIEPLSQDESIIDMVKERLFTSSENPRAMYSGYDWDTPFWGDQTKPYVVVHLENNAIGVIFKPNGFTAETARKHRFDLIRDIHKQLYVYESQSEVARNPLTLRYLELLSTN